MEVQDGFIVGIFNYCDRWCDRCALTTHCRLFADSAGVEAALDPSFEEVTSAPPPPDEASTPLPAWLSELIEEAESPGRLTDEELERLKPEVREAHKPIVAVATKYRTRVTRWLRENPLPSAGGAADAREVISWFHIFIPMKVSRALTTWPGEEPGDCSEPSDEDGSAKAALLGIERSHAAWLELMETGAVTVARGTSFIRELLWMSEALEAALPRARAFVRPGFDEPEALMRFLAEEGAAL